VSSTASICNALEEERLVARRNGGYVLGLRTVELAQRCLADLDPLADFSDVISRYETLRHETVQLAMLDGFDMLYVARRDADQPLRIQSSVGKRLPVNCTAVGKASLALLPPEERVLPKKLPALTSRSIVDPAELRAAIEESALRGYAIDDEETSDGVMCFGVARRHLGSEIYGVSVTLLKARVDADLERAIVRDLRDAADSLFPPVLGPA
jgi:DNA-binding IclR family transcriptional regulator